MSGITGSKLNIRGSGRVAKLGTDGQVLTSSGAGVTAAFEDAAGGGLDWQAVETGSTMTAVAGNGYPIDTTSNTCTITLPASASVGDQIMFTDYAGTWGTNEIILDSNGLNYQGQDDTYNVKYRTDDQVLHIVYIDTTEGWMPILDQTVTDDVPSKGNREGIFAYGHDGSGYSSVSNLVSNAGVIASDVTSVGTARYLLAGCEYGGDRGIVGYGSTASFQNMSNLVSNAGVVATDGAGVGTARGYIGACNYGGDRDKGIFGFGHTGPAYSAATNLVSNAGVVATDQAAVTGTARYSVQACEYGGDKGIFGFGTDGSVCDITNLVSNSGVVATDVTGVGTARQLPGACGYGGDKGIFGFGTTGSVTAVTNLVSNAGVVASDQAAVTGTARHTVAATQYGGAAYTGIFGFGTTGGGGNLGVSNLVSNTGVVATDVGAVGTARNGPGACSFN